MNPTLLAIRNILLWSFIINYAVIFVVWLLSLTGAYTYLMDCFFRFDGVQTQRFIANILAFWKIAGATLFLIPAIAIHLEYLRTKNKYSG